MDDLVTLTGYADQVRELIRNDRNDEAIAISKHILHYYPKYVDAYRQLGEAFLEKGQLDDAKELFRRVLSADPENVVAYAGLGVVLEQEHLIAEAAWHMERAYELAPTNVELQKELHRLYHELDGRPRARLELTPGALARLYIQEGLFAQAIQELNTIIAETAARFDARVALAQTLWCVGQMRQAAEVAQALLGRLPYCLKANLILGAVWKETGLAECDQYLERAQALDPSNQIAQSLFGAQSPLPLTEARVPRYVEAAPIAPTPVVEPSPPSAPRAGSAEVSAELIPESEQFGVPAFKPPVTDTTLPPWLRAPAPAIIEEQAASFPVIEPTIDAPLVTTPEVEATEEPRSAPTAQTPSELPPWLAQLQSSAEPSAEATPAAPIESAEEPPSALPWLRTEAKPEETAPTIPTWIEEVKSAEATEAPRTSKEQPQAEAESVLPPWVATPGAAEEAQSAEATETPRTSKEQPQAEATPTVPPWVAVLSHGEPVPVEPETKPREAELPPWLGQRTRPTEPAPTTSRVAPAEPPAVVPKRKRATRGDSHLVLARTYRDANQIQEALTEYDYVVQKAPRLVNQVIGDLEVLSQRPNAPLEAHRILGDAYTRADRLAEALEKYRYVLEHTAESSG